MAKIVQKQEMGVEDLESLEKLYGYFKKSCEKFKKAQGEDFRYSLDVDYEELTLKVYLSLKVEDNDYTERDPKLN